MVYFLPVWFAFLAGLMAAHIDLRPTYYRLRRQLINSQLRNNFMFDEERTYITNERLLAELGLPADDIESVLSSTEIKTSAGIWMRSLDGWTLLSREELGDEYDGR